MELKKFEKGIFKLNTTTIDKELWFYAKDVCDNLAIVNYIDAILDLDDDEKISIDKIQIGKKRIIG